jgi:GNAT superfamily N-acetyltransferase
MTAALRGKREHVRRSTPLFMITVRPYRSADADAVSHLIRNTMRISNSADYPMERLQPLIDYFSPGKVEALSRERTCFVAEEGGAIVGTAALDGDELVSFFVSPLKQRRGIGSLLLERLEAVASERGLRELRVSASLAGVSFYRRNWFQPAGDPVEATAGVHVPLRKVLTTDSATKCSTD